jgi:hypothetical protein
MPTTYTDLVPVRRVAVGDCAGPLGSGFDALARTAYAALLAAPWAESSEAPFLPVHDNGQTANKTIPHGDAWKCTYGYDASARTERSACGAVCYTFALPADATAGTAANIVSVALSVTGDRYLDAGVDLYLVPSASAAPPTVAELLALEPAGTYCATSSQTEPPNQRHGVTAAIVVEPGVAAQPYLHAALLLHDYTTNRGAWIEGGAMLDGPALSITFSRDVAADTGTGVLQSVFTPDNASQQLAIQFRVGGKASNAAGVAALVSSVLSGAAPLAAMQQNGGTVPALSTTGGFGATAGPSLAGVSASVAEGVGRCVGTVLFFDAAPLRRGCTVAIPSAGDTAIAARAIAFEVENVTTMPDWTSPDFWAGSAGACLGAVDFSTTAGASLPISRTPSTPFVGIVLFASRSLASLGTYSPAALTLPISY